MTANDFFWYVLPWIITAVAFGWLGYDRWIRPKHKHHRLHPGE